MVVEDLAKDWTVVSFESASSFPPSTRPFSNMKLISYVCVVQLWNFSLRSLYLHASILKVPSASWFLQSCPFALGISNLRTNTIRLHQELFTTVFPRIRYNYDLSIKWPSKGEFTVFNCLLHLHMAALRPEAESHAESFCISRLSNERSRKHWNEFEKPSDQQLAHRLFCHLQLRKTSLFSSQPRQTVYGTLPSTKLQ